jgi:hypothetical protein
MRMTGCADTVVPAATAPVAALGADVAVCCRASVVDVAARVPLITPPQIDQVLLLSPDLV